MKKTITMEELDDALALHRDWVNSNGKSGLRADFSDVDFAHSDLYVPLLAGVDFSQTICKGANFSGLKMDDYARFWACDLSGACFAGASVEEANFVDADLSHADFSGARASGASFRAAKLDGCNFSKAFAPRADFSSVSAHDADFSGAHLPRAKMLGADFSGANLMAVDLGGVDFSGAKLDGTSIDKSKLDPWQIE